MKIAIPTADGRLCAHFGHCQHFTMIQADAEGTIGEMEEVQPPAHEPGVLPRWLSEQNANVIIAGGMGQRAQQLLIAQGIQVVVGAPVAEPRQLAEDFLAGRLSSGQNSCDH